MRCPSFLGLAAVTVVSLSSVQTTSTKTDRTMRDVEPRNANAQRNNSMNAQQDSFRLGLVSLHTFVASQVSRQEQFPLSRTLQQCCNSPAMAGGMKSCLTRHEKQQQPCPKCNLCNLCMSWLLCCFLQDFQVGLRNGLPYRADWDAWAQPTRCFEAPQSAAWPLPTFPAPHWSAEVALGAKPF